MWDGYTQNGTYNREYPRQARQVKGSRAAVLPLSYCIHTTKAPTKSSIYAGLQQLLSQFVANLSLMSYYLPWSWRVGVSQARCPDEANAHNG